MILGSNVTLCKMSLMRVHYAKFWSFEISEGILRNQKIIIGLDSFSSQRVIYIFGPIWVILVFVSTTLLDVSSLWILKRCNITVIFFAPMLPNLKGH